MAANDNFSRNQEMAERAGYTGFSGRNAYENFMRKENMKKNANNPKVATKAYQGATGLVGNYAEGVILRAQKKMKEKEDAKVAGWGNATSPEAKAEIAAAQANAKTLQNRANYQDELGDKVKSFFSGPGWSLDPRKWNRYRPSIEAAEKERGTSGSSNNTKSFASMSQNEQNEKVRNWGNATSETAQKEIANAQAEAAAEEEAHPYNSNKDGGRRRRGRKATRKNRKASRKNRKASRKNRANRR